MAVGFTAVATSGDGDTWAAGVEPAAGEVDGADSLQADVSTAPSSPSSTRRLLATYSGITAIGSLTRPS
jgi:hypothetical protein